MRCGFSAMWRPIQTSSMPKAALLTTGGLWHSPNGMACARSSPTAASAWRSSSGRVGEPEQAQENLTAATTMYREMGMDFWLQQDLGMTSSAQARQYSSAV